MAFNASKQITNPKLLASTNFMIETVFKVTFMVSGNDA